MNANTDNRQQLLSRAECNILRGLAILGIVLHNYCHWLGPIVKENEYTYDQHNVDVLHQVLSHPDGCLPIHLLSFFGHYGVPVFLFLSAYGLVCKYEHGGSATRAGHAPLPPVPRFIAYHYLKLFKMMIVGFVAFTVVDAMTPGSWHYTVTQILAQLCMVNNVLPDPDHQIWPGPYWFFGLMLQLYIVYRLVLARRPWTYTVVLMAVCVLLQMVMEPDSDTMNRYRYNFMGGMLPFGLGLLYARYGHRLHTGLHGGWAYACMLLGACLLIYLCSLEFYLWALVPAWVCAAAVCAVRWLAAWPTALHTPVTTVLVWMGQVSAALFVCHPILRKVFIPISRGGDIYTGLLLYILASICVAWLFREVMKKIPNPQLK